MGRIMPMLQLLILMLGLSLAACSGQGGRVSPEAPAQAQGPLQESRQLLLVLAPAWDSVPATLQRYARTEADSAWQAVGRPVAVNLGRSGQGWGRGLHPAAAALAGEPVKHEGDGRAPTGLFALPAGFAYDPQEVAHTAMPVEPVTPILQCVEDTASRRYNALVNATDPAKDWNSTETMLRPDGLYRVGLLVNHNQHPALAGAGSCIFMHVWRGPGQPTAGCTAMELQAVKDILLWLRPEAHPVLAQFPRPVYERLREDWRLP